MGIAASTKGSLLMGSQTSDDEKIEETSNDSTAEQNEETVSSLEEDLTDNDWGLLSTIIQESKQISGDTSSSDDSVLLPKSMEQILITTLPQMSPRLTLKLRKAADGVFADDGGDDLTEEQRKQLETVGKVLVQVLDEGLKSGKELLSTLLESGEVRKLDGEIGKSLREGRLDMAFFTVLNMNIGDAADEAKKLQEEAGIDESEEPVQTMGDAAGASRYQILKHIYTRCQEEVEKSVSPGTGLLNKLLRTEVDSIRQNQLRHYLVPEENTITAADGSEIKIKGAKALVPPEELLKALADAVRQVRTVENAGGTDPKTAAGLVESCRQVAIEARVVIGEGYGAEDETFKKFEDGLQPVFRPSNADSEYIMGSS